MVAVVCAAAAWVLVPSALGWAFEPGQRYPKWAQALEQVRGFDCPLHLAAQVHPQGGARLGYGMDAHAVVRHRLLVLGDDLAQRLEREDPGLEIGAAVESERLVLSFERGQAEDVVASDWLRRFVDLRLVERSRAQMVFELRPEAARVAKERALRHLEDALVSRLDAAGIWEYKVERLGGDVIQAEIFGCAPRWLDVCN